MGSSKSINFKSEILVSPITRDLPKWLECMKGVLHNTTLVAVNLSPELYVYLHQSVFPLVAIPGEF